MPVRPYLRCAAHGATIGRIAVGFCPREDWCITYDPWHTDAADFEEAVADHLRDVHNVEGKAAEDWLREAWAVWLAQHPSSVSP